MATKYPSRVNVGITKYDIEHGKCGDPTHCMIRVAIGRELGLVHGYVKVDATGVSVTRRPDYREKAKLPKSALDALMIFDECGRLGLDPLDYVRPFNFALQFKKTTKVVKVSAERKQQIREAKAARFASGKPDRVSFKRSRIAGVSVSQKVAARLDKMALA